MATKTTYQLEKELEGARAHIVTLEARLEVAEDFQNAVFNVARVLAAFGFFAICVMVTV